MNKELIQKILNKACWDEQAQHELEDWLNVEKFAELIIKECTKLIEESTEDDEYWSRTTGAESIMAIEEHFGVE